MFVVVASRGGWLKGGLGRARLDVVCAVEGWSLRDDRDWDAWGSGFGLGCWGLMHIAANGELEIEVALSGDLFVY